MPNRLTRSSKVTPNSLRHQSTWSTIERALQGAKGAPIIGGGKKPDAAPWWPMWVQWLRNVLLGVLVGSSPKKTATITKKRRHLVENTSGCLVWDRAIMEEVAATAALVASSCYENHPCGTEGADAGINPVCSSANRKGTLEKRKFDHKEQLATHYDQSWMFLKKINYILICFKLSPSEIAYPPPRLERTINVARIAAIQGHNIEAHN